jgi:hypothetical protein
MLKTPSLLLTLLLATSLSAPAPNQCGSGGLWGSNCSASTDGTQVDVGGTRGSNGSGGSGGSDASTGNGSPPRGDGSTPNDQVGEEATAPESCAPTDVSCRGGGFTVEVIRDVTASDLASFVPARPSFDAEPAGVGIVGMPTNFVAGATTQTLTGTLFDLPVTVRFVPAAYVFDYGDGTSARSTSGGLAWAALGQPQFTATPTSHAYGARGTYVASVAVEYAASVDFGGGWIPVEGAVTATTGGQAVDVYAARTALVERTCAENPSGPGC